MTIVYEVAEQICPGFLAAPFGKGRGQPGWVRQHGRETQRRESQDNQQH